MRRAGKTFKEIGQSIGVSPSRASQVYYRALSLDNMTKQPHKWTYGLETKTANALISAGFESKDEVIASLNSGELGIDPITGRGTFYGIAQKSISEILQWAGEDAALLPTVQAAISLLTLHGYNVTKK